MIDFERTCRTCMKSEADVVLINLFGPLKIEDNWSLKLADVLKETIALQIIDGDGLPQNLCDGCVKNLQVMYSFRNQALNSENELRKIVSESFMVKNETDLGLKHEKQPVYDYDVEADLYDDFLIDTNPTKVETNSDILMFICNVCNKKYTKRKRFLKHLQHHDKPKVICPVCQKTFSKQSTLDRHLDKYCNLQRFSTNNGDTHSNIKHEIEIADAHHVMGKCSECDLIFDTPKSLILHYKEHSVHIDLEQQLFRCLRCMIDCTSLTTLEHHMGTHKGMNQDLLEVKTEKDCYECPDCHIMFEKQQSLGSHLKKHKIKSNYKSKDMYYCSLCDKGFTLKTILRRHMKLHSVDRPFKCTLCSKSYTRQDQLVMHMSKHDGKKRYSCTHCDKAFSQLCSLKDHERTHTGETPFLCSQCGKGFSNNSNLRQHLRRHSGVKPFSCNLCPKSFCTKGQLKSHLDTHTGVHPYKCDECGAAFTKPNSLKKHSLIHLGVKPFACDNCNKRFSSKDHLKRHQRIHTGEKPYRCPHCSRAFTQSNDLVKHVRSHLGQNIYQCTVCQAKFRLMRELKRHYPIHYINGTDPTPVQDIEAPLVLPKGCSEQDMDTNIPTDRQITITFNSNVLDKNSIGDITINIEPGKLTS